MALKFRHLLIAAFVAFVSWGFLTSWLPPLQILSYAFVAGAVCTFTVLLTITLLNSRPLQEYKTTVPAQTVSFIEPKSWQEETEWLSNIAETRRVSLFPSSFVVSNSIDELLEWLLRDFVSSWYNNISVEPAFRNRIDAALRQAVNVLRARIETQDIVENLVSRVTPLITDHLKAFYDAEHAVRGKKLNRTVTESEELDLAIAAKYKDGHLHPVASLSFSDTKLQQQDYLKKICTRLMPELVSETLLQSRAVAVLIREIVACAVLTPVLQLLCDPDTWNQVVENYGKSTLQDRKSVRKLRAALDEHASPMPKPPKSSSFPKLSPRDDERKFERFIRSIRQCNNLSEARRFRSEVASQYKRESSVEGQDPTYLRRLETGKRVLDQRVGMLSAVGGTQKISSGAELRVPHSDSRFANASLKDILYDASGLSYFMEYMDRQRFMSLVQFWVVVDGFRNPLEDDVTEENDSLGMPLKWTPSERQDIAQISEAYLARPEVKVPVQAQRDVQEFIKAGNNATPAQYSTARSAILKAQTAVMEEMQEKHLQNFRKSDLFYKLLSSDDASGRVNKQALPKTARNHSIATIQEEQPPTLAVPRRSSADIGSTQLKRNALSSSDLMGSVANDDDFLSQRPRRSLDVNTSGPLFRDDVEPESGHQPIFGTDSEVMSEDASTGQTDANQAQIEAMEAALNTIVSNDHQDDDLREGSIDSIDTGSLFPKEGDKDSPSRGSPHIDPGLAEKPSERPNLASLGLVSTASRIGVFTDNDLFGDEEKFIEDEQVEPETERDDKEGEEEIHEAAPGDLGLAEAISALTVDIDKLASQDSIVDTLTRKAELTNNVAELRILGKSKTSIQKELRRKELQRQQYIVQESDNSLYGRATVEIKSIMVGREEDRQEFALYVIEVQRKAGEHMPAAGWAVARRYSEFHDLHQRLRQRHPEVRNLEFPRRRLVMKLQREFLHKRRVSLEHYLRELLKIPDVCRSRDLRSFLSQRPITSSHKESSVDGDRADIVSRIYNSVTDGMEDFLGNIPVLDQLSAAGQNLISAATNQYFSNVATQNAAEQGLPGETPNATNSTSVREAQAAQAELEAFDNQAVEPLVKPICDVFLEAFELNRSQNWLRGRAVVVVLHQLLGGTVERKVREIAGSLVSETNLTKYLDMAKNIMWPGGVLQRDRKQRTTAEKKHSRREAEALLATLMPELVGGVVGRANAQAAGRRFFAAMNNERLNTHLVFQMLDEVVAILFPQ